MSMTFYGAKIENGQTKLVFSAAEMRDGTHVEHADGEYMFVPNPAYVPETDMSLSNANAYALLLTLGYTAEDGFWCAPVQEVIDRCTIWLRLRPSQEATYLDPFIDADRVRAALAAKYQAEDYLARRIDDLLKLARLTLERRGTEVYAC